MNLRSADGVQRIDSGMMAMSSNLKDFLQRARAGDKTAEQNILEYLRVRFSLFATRKIKDKQAAEDIVQDSCMTILEKYDVETFTVGFEEWAWGVLAVNIKSYFRRASVESRRIVSEHTTVDLQSLPAKETDLELERSILDCLMKIAEVNHRFARILSLVYQGYRTAEICEMLEITKSNCYVMLHRGRAMLRQCLSQKGYEI